ncbi:unnamed protein product [Rotaria sp. Silwood1]|nr:unnamed protein product [Rotaria sp. Silwood1]CAF1131637.1 unnamed protein product [Rotaria sp. Silwood1]CAF3526054.1 unnamed protein product [Rotaria sp. Silwood1]CAF4543313.1 unnamed protein product [Rotaria sp. Silwood1]CAF4603410.1 unnamed protein product [Rotaria sp. Silwood1]
MSESSEAISEKEKNALDIIKNWFLNSPTHGIRRISLATSIFERIFWSTTFLAFTTLMCVFIYTVILKYIGNPTKINLSVRQYRDPLNFPAITFCNLNPLRNDSLLDDNVYDQRGRNSRPLNTDSEYQNRFIEYMGRLLIRNLDNKRPITMESGYKLNDILIQCTFNGRLCYRNLTAFFHPNYGNCYTFNNEVHVEPTRQNTTVNFWSIDDEDVADGYKLFLELYLYQNEYIPYLDDRAAIRLFIHRKYQIPILSQNSLFLPPTTFTKLIFSQRIISLSHECRNDLTTDMKRIFNSNDIRYSQALCFKLCEFRFIERICHCTDQLLMVFFQFFSENNTTRTDTNSSCSIKDRCLLHRNRFNARKYCPECLPECELIQFKIQSSYADYPNTRSTDKVLTRVEKHLKTTGKSVVHLNTSACLNNRKGALLDNIVAVEISASPFATEILAESPMYTWVDVISSIGGQTGLWIGVSLISFVEIAELLFLLLCHFVQIIYQSILNQWKNFYQRLFMRKISPNVN